MFLGAMLNASRRVKLRMCCFIWFCCMSIHILTGEAINTTDGQYGKLPGYPDSCRIDFPMPGKVARGVSGRLSLW